MKKRIKMSTVGKVLARCWQGVGKELARCRQGVGILKQLARLCQQYAKDEGKANEQRGKKALSHVGDPHRFITEK